MSTAIYVANEPQAVYHPLMNKGHESMQYMTYIIDHYFGLPDVSIFVHAHQFSWHNNMVLDHNMADMVKNLNLDFVSRVGYFNLRCHEEPGCDGHIDLRATQPDKYIPEQIAAHETWKELHGNATMPDNLGAPCCSQFAVSREKLLSIPLEKWKFYRNWLINTNLTDGISGRIWEFTWHYILTGATELCPSIESCYCETYGVCFEPRAAVDTYMLAKDMNWLTNKLKESLKRQGDTETLDALDGHWSASTQLQYRHRLKDAKKAGQERSNKLRNGAKSRS